MSNSPVTHRTSRVAAVAVIIAAASVVNTAAPIVAQGTPPKPATSVTAVDSTARTVLKPVSVTVTREAARSPFEVPFATTRVVPDATRPGQRRVSMSDLLLGVPGVVVQDRANPSQDPRLSVRGFGARSAFGVRGVRVLRDGIPLSLPDGQTPVDWLELESIGSLDVVRGTAAALYGNAAGGVVDFHSKDPVAAPFAVDTRWWNGGGLTRTTATLSSAQSSTTAAARVHNAGASITATKTRGPGPRQWSRLDASHAFARTFATVGGTRLELQGTYYDTPRAENSGALTAAELSRDPRLPDSLNITKASRKAVNQKQVALIATRGGKNASLNATIFTGTRTLDNPLPFAIVAVDRTVTGASVRGSIRETLTPWPMRFSAGLDAQRQDDARLNFENCADLVRSSTPTAKCPTIGRERGAIRLDQRELVRGIGAFARAELEAPGRLFISAAARRDQLSFGVTDHFITASNADDSGNRTLAASTPMLGIVWRARPTTSVFASWTSAFETPTITELTNQDNGAAGLNTLLLPQTTRTVETGVQSLIAGRVRVELAAFRAVVHDELVPFDVPNQPGRRAFRNAGQTSRTGIESSVTASLPLVDVGASYTNSHFRFDRYIVGTTSYAGKPIPGLPSQVAQLWTTFRTHDAFATIDATFASRMTADDAATVNAAGYAIWSLRGGYTGGAWMRRLGVEPTAGVDNVFDRHYAPSVVINATRSRYFEPGLTRRGFVSLRVNAR